MYLLWVESYPFDIGNTTRTAFHGLKKGSTGHVGVVPAHLHVKKWNQDSQSNGSLMRCTPMAVYTHLLDYKTAHQVISQDVAFTHCHDNVVDAIYLYQSAIGYLIRHADSPSRHTDAIKYCTELCQKEGLVGNDVQNWFALSQKFAQQGKWNLNELNPNKSIGWLCHAFVLSFYYLQRVPNLSYEDCIYETMCFGGDTDTNGAIVGGMLGAYFGREALP